MFSNYVNTQKLYQQLSYKYPPLKSCPSIFLCWIFLFPLLDLYKHVQALPATNSHLPFTTKNFRKIIKYYFYISFSYVKDTQDSDHRFYVMQCIPYTLGISSSNAFRHKYYQIIGP